MTGKPRLHDARWQRFGMVRSLGRDNLASETVHRRAPYTPERHATRHQHYVKSASVHARARICTALGGLESGS
jgi:hypothetical protein